MTRVPTGAGPGPIGDVQEGMTVLDANGDEVGTVEMVRMGDPQAVTTQGQDTGGEGDPVAVLWRALGGGEPDVPAPIAARLLRHGFVKVDGKGLWGGEYYVRGDQVDGVTGQVVRLAVARDRLTTG